MKILAVDDEPLALSQLERYINSIPGLELVGKCYSVKKASEIMESQPVDLLLLDIEMPGGNGMEYAAALEKYNPYIIFITAYSKYAVDGFRVNAVDYLLKPLSLSEFKRGIEKVRELMRLREKDLEESETIYVKADGEMHSVRLSDILYLKSMSEYVQIKTRGSSKSLITLQSLKHFEATLPPEHFLRIHKSYIINLAYIQKGDAKTVTLNGMEFPIGEKYRKAIRDFMKNRG